MYTSTENLVNVNRVQVLQLQLFLKLIYLFSIQVHKQHKITLNSKEVCKGAYCLFIKKSLSADLWNYKDIEGCVGCWNADFEPLEILVELETWSYLPNPKTKRMHKFCKRSIFLVAPQWYLKSSVVSNRLYQSLSQRYYILQADRTEGF